MVENSLFAGPRSGVRRQVFLPYLESASPAAVTVYVRTAMPPAALVPTLQASSGRSPDRCQSPT